MGLLLIVRIKEKHSDRDFEYFNKVDLKNEKMIAGILRDIEIQFDAPIKKACKIVLKEDTFPI